LHSPCVQCTVGYVTRCISRSSDGNGQCSDDALPASLLCRSHGGALPDSRRAAAERVELAKLTVVNTLVATVEEACGVLLQIMRAGEKDSDRLKAVDRVLELAGIRTGQPLVQVNVQTGLRPQEDARDARLVAIIEKLDRERADVLRQTAIEAVARDAG
jgi:hypothetical protein